FRHSVPPDLTSVDELIARFQEHLDAMAEATRLEIAWRVALDREATLEQGIKELSVRVKQLLQAVLGEGNTQLREFGARPYVRRRPSTATMKLAVEKRRATRALRRTMGRRQRAKIKGGS